MRESVNCSDPELESVLITGLSDVAVVGRESLVGKLTDKLFLVERDGCGNTKDNQRTFQQRPNHEEQR